MPTGNHASVVTFGEALLRLTAPAGTRLSEASQLEVHVAGSEANVAAGLAQLGVPARWLGRLPQSPPGRLVERRLASLGVLTDAVQWADDGARLGLFFAEHGAGLRPGRVWYDRRDSAFAAMDALPDGVPGDARIVHVSGITPALGEGPAALLDELAERARAGRALLSVDVNYRATLWGAADARAVLTPLVARADVLVCAERDARRVFELDAEPPRLLEGLARIAAAARLVVLTRGADGCLALDDTGRRYEHPAPPTSLVDRFGMGDAFVAGVLWGLLRGDAGLGLRAGVELAAWKASLRGDLLRLEPGELHARLAHPEPEPEVVR